MKEGLLEGGGSVFTDVWRSRQALRAMVFAELRSRYTGSLLGFAWAVLHPLLLMSLYVLVFSVFLGVKPMGQGKGVQDYGIFLFAGMLPWILVSNTLETSPLSVLQSASLVRHYRFPIVLLPTAALASALLNTFIAGALFLLLLAFFYTVPTLSLLLLPPVGLMVLGLAFGLGMAVAALNVVERDIGQATVALLPFWFFSTPILYPIQMVPDTLRGLVYANPLSGLVLTCRAILLGTPYPEFPIILYSAAVSLTVFLMGAFIFHEVSTEFPDLV